LVRRTLFFWRMVAKKHHLTYGCQTENVTQNKIAYTLILSFSAPLVIAELRLLVETVVSSKVLEPEPGAIQVIQNTLFKGQECHVKWKKLP